LPLTFVSVTDLGPYCNRVPPEIDWTYAEGFLWSAKQGTKMAGEIGWGIMATGYIADLFSKDLVANGHHMAAVGSRSTEAAQRFAHRFDVPNAHGSYEALVADPAVDVVYIATPHPMHHAGAMMALEHGKHILVEKPFTLNARQADEIIELGNRKRLVVQEAMWTRFLPHMVRLREILASGVLGQIRAVIADHTQ